MNIERLTTTGPALAALLQEAALLRGPFDGLLIGAQVTCSFDLPAQVNMVDGKAASPLQATSLSAQNLFCTTQGTRLQSRRWRLTSAPSAAAQALAASTI